MTIIEREHPRFAHHAEISVTLRGALLSGRTVNVSRGGLCALLQMEVEVGTELELQLVLRFDDGAQSEAIRLRCRTVWCTPINGEYQLGFSFLNLAAAAQQDLELFLRFLDQRVKPARI